MAEVLGEQRRLVTFEFGAFYFGNWPTDASYESPDTVVGIRDGVVFTGNGLGLYSPRHEDDLAWVCIEFLADRPERAPESRCYEGEFVISAHFLTVATMNRDPREPFTPPFTGAARARAHRAELTDDTPPAAHEKWHIDIWPG